MANSRAAWNRHTSQPAVSANPTAAMVTSHGASTPRLRRAASTNAAAKTEVTPASTIRPARRSTIRRADHEEDPDQRRHQRDGQREHDDLRRGVVAGDEELRIAADHVEQWLGDGQPTQAEDDEGGDGGEAGELATA